MRWALLIGCWCAWSTCTAVSFVSLRDASDPNNRVGSAADWLIGQLPDSLWLDSNVQFIQHPLQHLQVESLEQLQARLAGKRVLVMLHGMAKTLTTAQTDFFNGLWTWKQAGGEAEVDEVLLVSWPGTAHVSIPGYLKANRLASKSGRQFHVLLEVLNASGCHVDILTHSMGSKVALRALKSGSSCEGLFLMAPSVWKWTIRPGRKWARGFSQATGMRGVYFSRGDWAFNFTAINKMGLGFNGVSLRKTDRFEQLDCSAFVNQDAYRALRKSRFRTRSNHSMYWQTPQVFDRVKLLSGHS